MEPSSSTLVYLAYNLDNPINYFPPKPLIPDSILNELSVLEKEILILTKKISKIDQIKLEAQSRVLSKLENE